MGMIRQLLLGLCPHTLNFNSFVIISLKKALLFLGFLYSDGTTQIYMKKGKFERGKKR